MGVDDSGDAVMRNAPSAPEEEEHQMDTSDIKLDTVVLPEGVCLLDKAFAIIEKDPDGKKFDRGRDACRSDISHSLSQFRVLSVAAPMPLSNYYWM